jgi:hypothetical protein
MTADTRRGFLRLAAGAAGASIVSLSTRLAPDSRAAALACGRAKPAVHMDVSAPEPVIDNSLPQRAIQAINPGYHGGRTIGLYAAETQAKIQTQFRSLGVRGGKAAPVCLYITAVDLRLFMPTRRIYVSSELWPDTCPYTAVLGHERKHEAADDQAIRKHAPRIQQAVEDALANLGPLEMPADERDAAQARWTHLVQSAFDKAWATFQGERNELQRQVDSGLEYARVTASCPDWSQIQN